MNTDIVDVNSLTEEDIRNYLLDTDLLEAKKPCNFVLDVASEGGKLEIVKLLLAAGSPYSDCTTDTLDFASEYGYTEIVRLLLESR